MTRDSKILLSDPETAAQEAEWLAIRHLPTLPPEMIWKITRDNFYRWRQIHDLPRILVAFKARFPDFEEWQKEQNVPDEMIIALGISNCINHNVFGKDKKRVIVQTTAQSRWEYVAEEYEAIKYRYYQKPSETQTVIKREFLGFFDWRRLVKGIKNEDRRAISERSSQGEGVDKKVFLFNSLELLKVGGIRLSGPVNAFNAKYFEFVNATSLTITGDNLFRGFPVAFVNSAVDNLVFENYNGVYFHFERSDLYDLKFTGSSLQIINFLQCELRGQLVDSALKWGNLFGGSFTVDFKDSTLFDFDIRQSPKREHNFELYYRTAKNIYAAQGEDSQAITYFILEREVKRLDSRNRIFRKYGEDKEIQHGSIGFRAGVKYHFGHFLKFSRDTISLAFWGYGHKPVRVLYSALGIILVFAYLYSFWPNHFHKPDEQVCMHWDDYLYFSIVSFTTLGYGDFYLTEGYKLLSAIEALLGATCLGFLVAGYANNKY